MVDGLDARAVERKGPRAVAPAAGREKVQLRLATALTFDAYVTGAGWKTARLSSCPECAGPVTSHGTYRRKRPNAAEIARFYCESCRMTIGLLPDFYASRMPALLDDLEQVVAAAESARSVESAAEAVRPADEPEAVTLPSALRWLRRRVAPIHRILATVIGLLPGRFEGCAPTVASFRQRLGTARALAGGLATGQPPRHPRAFRSPRSR